MFSGIIADIGSIKQVTDRDGGLRLVIATSALDLGDVHDGDSIAVNGICLTVVEHTSDSFAVDVSRETLNCTEGLEAIGEPVNLEKALRLADRLGGHLVSGHSDGTGTVLELKQDARSVRLLIQAPAELARYICKKGSICVDGVSLTVNEVTDNTFGVNIIPHTLHQTIFADYAAGTRVNLEVDIIARYLERLHYPHS
jgi:riboflavin synthase